MKARLSTFVMALLLAACSGNDQPRTSSTQPDVRPNPAKPQTAATATKPIKQVNPTLVAALAETTTIPATAETDAAIFINFDEWTGSCTGNPRCAVQVGQHDMGPWVRFAPTARTEPYRPAPGVIEEKRAIIEFDLASLAGATSVGSAVLKMRVQLNTPFPPSATVTIHARGYDADGVMAMEDFGYPISSLPTVRDLGYLVVSSSGVVELTVTDLVNDLLGRGVRWAGINLQTEYNGFDRTLLGGDTTMGVDVFATETGDGPLLQISPTTNHEFAEGEPVAVSTGGYVFDAESAAYIYLPPGYADVDYAFQIASSPPAFTSTPPGFTAVSDFVTVTAGTGGVHVTLGQPATVYAPALTSLCEVAPPEGYHLIVECEQFSAGACSWLNLYTGSEYTFVHGAGLCTAVFKVNQFSTVFAAIVDNCPSVANPDQADADKDGIGDACEAPGQQNVFNATIDIRPGQSVNPVNPAKKDMRGKIPVALLSTPAFDAVGQVDRSSLTFGRTGDEPSLFDCTEYDANADGLRDLVCTFLTKTANFTYGDTNGTLKGALQSGTVFLSTDAVRVLR